MEESKYINPLAERESVEPVKVKEEAKKFLPNLKWWEADPKPHRFDATKPRITSQYTLSYNGVPFAPLGGIHALTGQAGHGKTAFFTMLIAAILKGEYCGLRYELSREIPNPKVLYIDTEMEDINTQLVWIRICKVMGWDEHVNRNDELMIIRLREVNTAEERWKITLNAIYEMQPTVVFLDGLIDVLNDFNDNKECSERIYQDMNAASHYNLSFWNILHQNPGSTKMTGHSGSFLERKATDVFMVQKEKELGMVGFTAKQIKARGKDVEDMTYKFRDDEEHIGIPYIEIKDGDDDDQPVAGDFTMAQLLEFANLIGMKDISLTTFRDRIKDYMRKPDGKTIGNSKASDAVHACVKFGLVLCKDGRYTKAAQPLMDAAEYDIKDEGMKFEDIINDVF